MSLRIGNLQLAAWDWIIKKKTKTKTKQNKTKAKKQQKQQQKKQKRKEINKTILLHLLYKKTTTLLNSKSKLEQ